MEVSANEMITKINNNLITNEKSICPVFGAVKRKVKKISDRVSDNAYITITTLDRLILYRFDDYSSYVEYFTFDTLIMGDVDKTSGGQYIAELSFLTEKGTRDICLIFSSAVKGKNFPNQAMNAEFLYKMLDSKIK